MKQEKIRPVDLRGRSFDVRIGILNQLLEVLRVRKLLIPLFVVSFTLPATAVPNPDEARTTTTDFVARNLNGKKIRLKNFLREGPVVLDFWALWCIPCLKALPHLQKIQNQYGDRGLRVIAINEDSPSDQSKVKPYVKRKRLKFEVVFDEDKDLWYQFRIALLPTTLLLDRQGQIVYSHTGYKPGDENKLIERIEQLLAQKSERGNTD